ncbi:MliC family protein [Ancylobacter terrae]|uniref:MliC family protein n=1 Tax=Ancylobacter sp. sgz301288 TaxID=3342077 RepID=UPI00385D1146
MNRTFFAAAMAALAALAATIGPAAAIEARFTCSDGGRLEAVFTGGESEPGAVTLRFEQGPPLRLPQVISADGGRYADGDVEFWVKGKGGTLTRNGATVKCEAAG